MSSRISRAIAETIACSIMDARPSTLGRSGICHEESLLPNLATVEESTEAIEQRIIGLLTKRGTMSRGGIVSALGHVGLPQPRVVGVLHDMVRDRKLLSRSVTTTFREDWQRTTSTYCLPEGKRGGRVRSKAGVR